MVCSGGNASNCEFKPINLGISPANIQTITPGEDRVSMYWDNTELPDDAIQVFIRKDRSLLSPGTIPYGGYLIPDSITTVLRIGGMLTITQLDPGTKYNLFFRNETTTEFGPLEKHIFQTTGDPVTEPEDPVYEPGMKDWDPLEDWDPNADW